ncbi:MAG: hypothetical protein ACL7BU_15845 [Candidatus Phlomobacter fragariae]
MNHKQKWITKPKIYEPNKLVLADEQHVRNNKFYNQLASLYRNQKIISNKEERKLNLPTSDYLLTLLIYNLARLILKKLMKRILELDQEYISHDGKIYPQALMELRSLIRPLTTHDMTEQSFIELIIEIFSLSNSSFNLLNQLLSKEDH